MIVVEISGAVDESGTVRKWLFGDRGWATGPGDIPANTEVSGDLLDPGYLGVQAFDQNKFGGGTKLEIGEVIIANTDGALDEFINYGFDGRAVYIRQGEPGDLYPGQFSTILTATVDGKPECSFEEVVFRLRDKSWLFEAQVLNERYAGTNAGPTGIEGGPDDIKDTVKPWLLGKATYFSPPCVNTSTLTFQVSKRRIQSIQAVYDGGLPLVFDIDYQRSSLLNAVTIAAGSYATCLAEGLFRLGGAPEGEVTCDATEGDLPANRTVAQILRTLALEAGVTEQEVYEPDLTALDLKNSAVVGVWINDEDSFLAYMDRVAISAGAAYYFDRLGMFRMGRLELPTGLDAVGTLTNADVSEINLATNGLQGLPVSAVKVNYSLYYTTQTDPLGAVTTQRRAEIAQAYRSSVKEDASVKLQFIQAPTLEVDTLLTSRADAEAESQRMLTLFRRPRHYFEVTITQDEFASIPNLGLFSAVLLQMPRFGMDETAAFLVTGLRLRLGEAKADLTLWGGGPGVVYMEMTGRAVAYIAAEAVLGIVEQSVSLSVDMPADIAVAALAPEVTVPWWDATAKAHLNFELQEVRLYGVAATWSDYIDETGAATATLRAMLPGFATSGVAVWKAKDAPLDGYRGLWGYVGGAGSEGRNAVGWWGNGATTQTAGIKPGGTDVTTPIPDSAADDDPFAVGVSWAAAGAKVCGSNAGAVASTATAFPAKTVDEAYLWNDGYGDVPFNGTRQHLLVFDPQDIGGSAGALVSDAVLQAKTITVVGLLPTTNQVPATNITLAALAPTVEASAGWSVLFRDDSTKPLSLRRGVAQTINGQAVGPFAYGAMVAADARGSYSTFEWTDGWGMADPHQVGSRRDDQTYMFNPIGAGPFAAGHCNITRDTAAGTTTLRMRRKSGLPNASGLTPHAYEARVDGSMTSAELNMLHSLSGPPPYEIVVEGIDDPQGVQEAWTAFWTRQADSHQSATNYTQEVSGAHTEQDFWERTGLLATTNKIFINHIYDVGGGVIQGFGGGYTPDMGGVIGESLWDTRIVVTETTTFNYIRPHTSPEADWTLYFQWDHPAASRFSSAPVYLQIDAKAGYRWSDLPGWVKSIDGSTPDYDLTWKSVTVSVPSSNVANWTNTTIDPDDIPDMAPTWDVDPASWDNSVATATVLATFTTNTGFSYQVHGLTGIAFVGDQIQTTGLMPAGTREIVVWAERDSDAAVFLVGVYEVTVADNAVWYDADAKVHLNFQSQQVREYGVAGTWSDYIDGNGEATATLRAMMPGYASAGVAVWYGSGAPSSGWKGLWGYPSLNTTGMYAVEWIGNGAAAQQAAIKTSENIDRLATVAGTDANADAFTIGVSWAVAGAKVCGNAGDVTASGAAFEANNGAAGKLWNNGYGDRTFDGTRQFIALYDPEDIGGAAGALVSDAILQGKCGVYVPPTPPPSEWDDTAKVHLNFETSEVREYGVAGTWSDYIDGGGNATALLRGLLMGYASSGVAVWKGTGGGNGYHSLWGYPSATNTGNNCVQWVGNGTSAQSAIVKTSENVDHTATIANTDTDADPFALGVSWSASAAKVCGNGGSCASSANGFEANSGTDALLWNGYYGDRAFDGTKQQLLIFAPEDIGGSAGAVVSDAILQGKAVAL